MATKFLQMLLGVYQDVVEKTLKLEPDPNAHDPNLAWQQLKGNQKVRKLEPLDPQTPVSPDKVRFVCISDTHTILEKHRKIPIPDGDVLLHAGDMTMYGKPDEVHLVNEYLGTLPHKHKIVIAGNHDMTFDHKFVSSRKFMWHVDPRENEQKLREYGAETVQELMNSCTYLEDSGVELYGIKIYGSPWTPGTGSWGFQQPRGAQLMGKWNDIPDDTDILITHCPPLGYGDEVPNKLSRICLFKDLCSARVGCVDLLNTIQKRVMPKYCVYGHIHEGYGVYTDGTSTFINAAVCDEYYNAVNQPIVFDFPLPPNHSKTDGGHL